MIPFLDFLHVKLRHHILCSFRAFDHHVELHFLLHRTVSSAKLPRIYRSSACTCHALRNTWTRSDLSCQKGTRRSREEWVPLIAAGVVFLSNVHKCLNSALRISLVRLFVSRFYFAKLLSALRNVSTTKFTPKCECPLLCLTAHVLVCFMFRLCPLCEELYLDQCGRFIVCTCGFKLDMEVRRWWRVAYDVNELL